MKFICPICQKPFFSYNKKRKTCSRYCTGIYQSNTVIKNCDFCGEEIRRNAGNFRGIRSFCGRKCEHDWEKIGKVKFPQLRNKDWCIEQYEKLSLKKISEKLNCGETTVFKYFKYHGIKLDRKQWLRGNLHYAWKNGITELARAIRTCSENMKWKKEVWNKNPHFCIQCNSTKNLEIDHIKKFKFILIDNHIKTLDDARKCTELWDVKNGRILCRKCNKVDCNLNRKSYPDSPKTS